jgi:acyl carrier protein
MSDPDLRAGILELLREIAPELDAGALDPKARLREAVDLDSMDFLNFLMSLHRRYGIDIPEADYAELTTLDDVVRYLSRKGVKT